MFCEVLFAGLGGYVRKKWSKNSWYREKNLERICVWNDDIVKEISNEKVKNEMGIFFVIQHVAFFRVTLQQNINMMVKIRECDACWSCLKMLNFGSKTLKMFEFTRWIDLLLRDIQYFVFRKNGLFRFRFDEFTWPQHYGTPKFWPKISHSEKSVEFLLTKVDMR